MKTLAKLELLENNEGHTGISINGSGYDIVLLLALVSSELEFKQPAYLRSQFRATLLSEMNTARKLKKEEEANENQ